MALEVRVWETDSKIKKNGRWLPRVRTSRIAPSSLSDEDFVSAVFDQNEIAGGVSLEQFKREFRPIFKKGKRGGPKHHFVVEVSPSVRKTLVDGGSRRYAGIVGGVIFEMLALIRLSQQFVSRVRLGGFTMIMLLDLVTAILFFGGWTQ
ncbi:hypothetical protein J6590_076251 [Homalodisca vitripennis]|nr:hypothetical protein J6590_076251 [Homalodisca vitripennis]